MTAAAEISRLQAGESFRTRRGAFMDWMAGGVAGDVDSEAFTDGAPGTLSFAAAPCVGAGAWGADCGSSAMAPVQRWWKSAGMSDASSASALSSRSS